MSPERCLATSAADRRTESAPPRGARMRPRRVNIESPAADVYNRAPHFAVITLDNSKVARCGGSRGTHRLVAA